MDPAATITVKSTARRVSRWALARQSLVSFVVVLVGYWCYWLLAVPLIEPSDEVRLAQNVTEEQVGRARVDLSLRQKELAQFFHPDDWEANGPKFFNLKQTRLLFRDLTTKPDGWIELTPCTLMFFPQENALNAGPPIIMRTDRARLKFDKEVDVSNVNPGDRKFERGELDGVVRITQRETSPGKGDDMEITTSGVRMSADRVFTPEAVKFRFGRSRGTGRELEIMLVSADSGQNGTALRGLSARSLELKREVRMRLEMGDGPLAGAEAQAQPANASGGDRPLEITCKGPFQFDMQEYAASFHQEVDVFLIHPAGESDQLNCQLLRVYFAKPGEAAPPGSAAPGAAAAGGTRSAASNLRLIEARGKPVVMRSPSQGVYARCDGLDYVPGLPGEAGTLVAFGPGVIVGNRPDDPAGKYTASWTRELRFEPDGVLQRASLYGETIINIAQMGEIKADEVFAWLSKKPVAPSPAPSQTTQSVYQRDARATTVNYGAQPAKPQRQSGLPGGDAWQIEHLAARRYQTAEAGQSKGDVRIESPQFQATANTLEAVVVRSKDPAAGGAPPPGAGGDAPASASPAQRPQDPNELFKVQGGNVKIQLVQKGEQLTVSTATIERQAQLEQWTTANGPPKRTLLVKGERLHVANAQADSARVTITGQPGFVEADGMSLWGATIEMAVKDDHLWIVGPGRLLLPIAQDMDGKPLARPQTMTVDWKQGMDFQRATAVFTGAVVARSSQQVVNAETLEATLSRAIDFANPNVGAGRSDQRIDLAAVRTRGWTFLEGRQLDESGQQTSFSQMGVNDLSINRASGAIGGVGPGWVKHVSLGAPQALGPPDPTAAATVAAKPAVKKTAKDELTYLYVTFRQGIEGDLNKRRVKFFDQTKTIYGPVAGWNDQLSDKDLAGLGATGMSLDADSLEVREMGSRPESKRGYFELDALGSVFAEGQRFTALGQQLTYAERNDQLALRGEPAEIYMEDEAGGARRECRAKFLQYWFNDHRISINGANLLNLGLPSSPRPPSDAAKPQAAATSAPSPVSTPSSAVPQASSQFGATPR